MKRSKKLVLLAHCILNVNSKVVGLAQYAGAIESVVTGHVRRGNGIIQLPCPETTFLGLKRWGMTREQYDTPFYRSHCRNILQPYIQQIEDYLANDYTVEEIVGVDGSPSCGVNLTCAGYCGGEMDDAARQHNNLREINGRGIMMEVLVELLAEKGITARFTAISEKESK
jgi:predicted secreted protein